MTSLALCRASSKMSIMPSVATRRSDTKVLLNLKRNTPGRSPFERLKPVHPKGCTSNADQNLAHIARLAASIRSAENRVHGGAGRKNRVRSIKKEFKCQAAWRISRD